MCTATRFDFCRPRSTTHSGGGGRISSACCCRAPRSSSCAIQASICATAAVACWTTTRRAKWRKSSLDGARSFTRSILRRRLFPATPGQRKERASCTITGRASTATRVERGARPPVRWHRHTADEYGFALLYPGPLPRATPHRRARSRESSDGVSEADDRTACSLLAFSLPPPLRWRGRSPPGCPARWCARGPGPRSPRPRVSASVPGSGPSAAGCTGQDAGTGQGRSVLLASVAGFPYQRAPAGTSSPFIRNESGAKVASLPTLTP